MPSKDPLSVSSPQHLALAATTSVAVQVSGPLVRRAFFLTFHN
jgi:hypothetical protein